VEGIRRVDFRGTSNADLTLEEDGDRIDVECKRPQTADALMPRMREARVQLEQPCREGRQGIIALDCSTIVRPPGSLLQYTWTQPESGVSGLLQRLVPTFDAHLTPQILGLILGARVAAMWKSAPAPILNSQGEEDFSYRPETILTWVVASNAQAPGSDRLRGIAGNIAEWQSDHRHAIA
jgi:hypothetical protein